MKRIITAIIFILYETLVLAKPRVVTVDECVDIALQNHPDYFIAIEDQKKNLSDYKAVIAQKSLIINGEITTVENDKDTDTTTKGVKIPGKDTNIGLFAGISVNYNIFDARTDSKEDISRTNIDMSKIRSYKTKLEIIFEVKSAYYGYLMARNILIIREEIYRKNQKKLALSRQLFEGGSRPILDVSKAEVDLADAQLQYEMARNYERKMKMNLFHAMGLEDSGEIELEPVDIDVIPDVTVSLDELYKISQVYSPAIRLAALEKKLAGLRITAEEAAHYPRIDMKFGFGYELERIRGAANAGDNFNPDNWSPTFYGLFSVTIPIYSGGAISASVDSAENEYNKSNYKAKEVLIQTKNQIRDNYRSLDDIKKQMDISELILKNAERHLLLAQKSYDNGGGSPLELQDAELTVIRAKIGYIEAKYNYLITLARLSQIIGIGEESICGKSVKKQSE